MNKRLREIVDYKTNGKNKPFAELVGWTPQYLGKLLHGNDFGLKPVLAILRALPEINARWLLLGEGQMLLDNSVGDLYRGTLNHIQAVIDLERFVPVMSPEELLEYQRMITAHKAETFNAEVRAKWIELSAERIQETEARVEQAKQKSKKSCRQRTARK